MLSLRLPPSSLPFLLLLALFRLCEKPQKGPDCVTEPPSLSFCPTAYLQEAMTSNLL